MIKILFLLLIISSPSAFAEVVRVIDNGNGVSVMTASGSLDDGFENHPLYGRRYVDIDRKDLPPLADRNFWVLSGSKVSVDNNKKADFQNAKAQEVAEKEAVYTKLKISKEEFEKIKR